MRKIAVFDTNILFSAAGWKGKPFLCLELARAGMVDDVTCPELCKLKVILADPDDDKVLECAATVAATHIVTGDRRHLLPLGTFQGISIVTPTDFLALATAP